MRWNSIAGKTYQVQYTTSLTQMDWKNLGNPINATNASVTASDAAWPDAQRFYRIILAP
jgi:hypothetical protein